MNVSQLNLTEITQEKPMTALHLIGPEKKLMFTTCIGPEKLKFITWGEKILAFLLYRVFFLLVPPKKSKYGTGPTPQHLDWRLIADLLMPERQS